MGHFVAVCHLDEFFHEIFEIEVQRGNVYGKHKVLKRCVFPGLLHFAGLFEHVKVKGYDETVFFKHSKEIERHAETVDPVIPAAQHFGAGNLGSQHVYFGEKIRNKFIVRQGSGHLVFDDLPLFFLFFEGFIHDAGIPAVLFCMIERGVASVEDIVETHRSGLICDYTYGK